MCANSCPTASWPWLHPQGGWTRMEYGSFPSVAPASSVWDRPCCALARCRLDPSLVPFSFLIRWKVKNSSRPATSHRCSGYPRTSMMYPSWIKTLPSPPDEAAQEWSGGTRNLIDLPFFIGSCKVHGRSIRMASVSKVWSDQSAPTPFAGRTLV